MHPQTIEVSTGTIIKTLAILIALLVAWQLRFVFILILASVILMTAFAQISDFLQSKGLNRFSAAVTAYVLALIFWGLLLFLVLPPLIIQLREFIIDLPGFLVKISEIYGGSFVPGVENKEIFNVGANYIVNGLDSALRVVFTTINGLFNVITIAVLSFYLLLERDRIKKNFHQIIPFLPKERVTNLVHKVDVQLGHWVRGEIALMFIVGMATYIGLTLLNVPYALPLAVMTGILEFIPNIGPILSGFIATLVTVASGSPVSAVGVVVLYVIVQQLENNILVPKIMQAAVGLNPLVAILSFLVGATLFGFPGALIAVPTAAMLQVVVLDLFEFTNEK